MDIFSDRVALYVRPTAMLSSRRPVLETSLKDIPVAVFSMKAAFAVLMSFREYDADTERLCLPLKSYEALIYAEWLCVDASSSGESPEVGLVAYSVPSGILRLSYLS